MSDIPQRNQGLAATGPRISSVRWPRGSALAIVVLVLAFVLLRPFCDLAAADQVHVAPTATVAGHGVAGHADSGTPLSAACCAQISAGTVVNPAASLVSWLSVAPLGAALFVLAGLPLFASSRHPARFRLAAPPERSFYARSARILR